MEKYTTSMFEKIKDALDNNKKPGSAQWQNLLRTTPGNSYVVRLIPNIKSPDKTWFHYYMHSWQSRVTGQMVYGLCPRTYDERCPVCEARMKLYNSGKESDKDIARLLAQREYWLVNVLVVLDKTNEDNNGSLKVLRFGKQIHKIIKEATEGEDAEELGPAIFDLSGNGCSFRVKVEKNEGGFPSYVSSKFLPKKAISGLTKERVKELYDNLFDLEEMIEGKSFDELQELVNLHVFGETDTEEKTIDVQNTELSEDVKNSETVDDLLDNITNESSTDDKLNETEDLDDDDDEDDPDLKELLQGL